MIAPAPLPVLAARAARASVLTAVLFAAFAVACGDDGGDTDPASPSRRGEGGAGQAGATARAGSAGAGAAGAGAQGGGVGGSAGTSAQGGSAGTSAQGGAGGTSAQGGAGGTSAQGGAGGTSAQGGSAGTSTQGGGAGSSAQGGAGGGSGQAGSGGWATLAPGTTWQWQLTGVVNETVLDASKNPQKMIDIDMFGATPALVQRLKNKGIYVVCYVESGDWASGRPDAGDYAPSLLGNVIDGFPDERFIDVRKLDGPKGPTGKTLRDILLARLDLAKSKGCQGIEPDLDDLHTYPTGFGITQAQMVAYNAELIAAAHARGMSMGLKNGPEGSFPKAMYDAGADWVVNEECNQYDECGGYEVFVAGGRAVFQVEYLDNQDKPYGGAKGTCALDNARNFDGIVKDSSSELAALPWIPCR